MIDSRLVKHVVHVVRNIPYRGWLLGLLLVVLPLSCINAVRPSDLPLQHSLTVLLLAVLVTTGIRRPLGNLSYTLLFAYLILHCIGAHYLYSFVPYDDWTERVFDVRTSDLEVFHALHACLFQERSAVRVDQEIDSCRLQDALVWLALVFHGQHVFQPTTG